MHVWVLFFSIYAADQIEASLGWLTIYDVLVVAMVLVASIYARHPFFDSGNRIDYPISCMLLIGTLFIVIAPYTGFAQVLLIIAIIIGGLGTSWSYLRWGAFYGKLDTRSATGFLLVAAILGCLVKFALGFVPIQVAAIIISPFPVLSFMFLRRSDAHVSEEKVSSYHLEITDYPGLWRVGLCVAITSLVCTFANGISSGIASAYGIDTRMLTTGLSRMVNAVILVCIFIWIFRAHRSFSFTQLWDIVLLSTGLSLLMFFTGYDLLGYALESISLDFIVFFFWLFLADIAHHGSIHPYVIFGFGWVVYAVPRCLGGSLLRGITGIEAFTPAVLFALLFVLFIMAMLCLGGRDPYIQRVFSDLDDKVPPPEDYSLIDDRCKAVAEKFKLAPRELEIMQMICKGRSKTFIAETLCISENTVRSHSRRLYIKLGVHSKQEMQELIGL